MESVNENIEKECEAALKIADSIRKGKPEEVDLDLCGLVGARIVSHFEEAGFEYISKPEQPFPFIIGPDELNKIVKASTHMEMMQLIGIQRARVLKKLSEGQTYRLLIFPKTAVGGLISPTWDNILELVASESRECGEKLEPHIETMRNMTYLELVEAIGVDPEKTLGTEMYEKCGSFTSYADPSTPGDLRHARVFLRHTLKCTPLFAGDGYAYTEGGERGCREFLVKRKAVADIVGAQWVYMDFS